MQGIDAWLLSTLSSTLVVSLLMAAAAWLARNWISTRLAASIRHEFDTKLADSNSAHRRSELSLEASLRNKQLQIDALSSSALSGVSNRQAAILQRKLLAIDQLWSAFNTLAPARVAATFLSVLNYEAAAKEAEKNERFREMFKTVGGIDMKTLHSPEAWKARPHVSELAWSFYSAYSAIVSVAALKMKQLELGLNMKMTDDVKVLNLVKAALPHREEYIEKHGMGGVVFHLLPELESSLLAEFKLMLSGVADNEESVKQAAQISKMVEAVNRDLSAASESPAGDAAPNFKREASTMPPF